MNPTIRCLIISGNQVTSPYPVYPIGAACLVSSLESHGHEASHFDVLADGGLGPLEVLLRQEQFDLIGLSIRNLDTVDSSDPRDYLDDIVDLMGIIRKNSDGPVVIGGPAFSILPGPLMRLLRADYGIVGEGEELLCRLADRIGRGEPPPSQIFTAPPIENPWQTSCMSTSSVDYYLQYGGMLNLQTKRGCPNQCSYCSYPTIEGQQVRYRDPVEVAEEMILLKEKHGARYLFFTDSVFNDQRGHYLDVAEALIEREVDLPWCAFFRPAGLGRKELQLLKRAGMTAMELGTDAACDRTLSGINKRFSFADVERLQGDIVREEIPSAHFVMFGGPGEDRETLIEGLENLDRLEHCVVFAFVGIRILPRTGIHVRALSEGLLAPDDPLLKPTFYVSPQIEQEEIEAAIRKSFAQRMDRVYPCHEFDQRISTLHQMGHTGPLWDFILKKNSRNR